MIEIVTRPRDVAPPEQVASVSFDDELRRQPGRAHELRQQLTGPRGPPRLGQVEGALQVVAGVEARGEQEVAPLVGPAGGQLGEAHRRSHSPSRAMP